MAELLLARVVGEHLRDILTRRMRFCTPRPHEDERRHASWLELFFDVVFVVAITELSQQLVVDHSAAGFVRFTSGSRGGPLGYGTVVRDCLPFEQTGTNLRRVNFLGSSDANFELAKKAAVASCQLVSD